MYRFSKIKFIFIGCIILVVLLVFSMIAIPISTTYLMEDVAVYIDSSYKEDFKALISKKEFTDGIEQLFSSTDQRAQIVEVAIAEIGTLEDGENNIKYNDWYVPMHTWLKKEPFNSRPEYCAIFTMWCLNEIGMYVTNSTGPPAIESAACATGANGYMSHGRFMYSKSDYEPRPGDLIYFTKWDIEATAVGYGSFHTGIIIKCDEEYIYTVEGNTSAPAGEVEGSGWGVFSKKYKRPKEGESTSILGYGIPWYTGEDDFNSPDGMTIE